MELFVVNIMHRFSIKSMPHNLLSSCNISKVLKYFNDVLQKNSATLE